MSPSTDDGQSNDRPAPVAAPRSARVIKFISRKERASQTASSGPRVNVAAGWVQFAVIVVLGLSFIAWFFVFR